jgi:hypothetical protein
VLRTRAERIDGGWSTAAASGSSPAEGAAFTICMALTDEGATMFLIDDDNPGWRVDRLLHVTDRSFLAGMLRSCSRTAESATTRSSGPPAKASGTRRCGSARRG